MATLKVSLKRRPWAWAGGTALLVIGAILGFRRYQERPLTEFPRPPIPKAFPVCPEVPTAIYDWHGIAFRYPSDWVVLADQGDSPRSAKRTLFVKPRRRESALLTAQSIVLIAEKGSTSIRRTVDGAWSVPKGEKIDPLRFEELGDETVPGSIQPVEVSGRRALLFLQRGKGLMPKENDEWSLLIEGSGEDYSVGSPTMFNPYRLADGPTATLDEELERQNKVCECAYWTVVTSLKLP